MLTETSKIRAKDIPIEQTTSNGAGEQWYYKVTFPTTQNLNQITKEVAKELVKEALRRAGTKQEAASMLGISRHALSHQIKTLNI
jgi:transcriptional regulator with PAS, ATPase and Fis domain